MYTENAIVYNVVGVMDVVLFFLMYVVLNLLGVVYLFCHVKVMCVYFMCNPLAILNVALLICSMVRFMSLLLCCCVGSVCRCGVGFLVCVC